MKLRQEYSSLPSSFYKPSLPLPASNPSIVLWNEQLATTLDITNTSESKHSLLLEILSGQKIVADSTPVACAYAGHQFGHFNPQLGDGRAHLLGELVSLDGKICDLQLKGSGATPFSRGGDGRCAIKPAIREFLMSEAMHALGVPTTRCLSVILTGDQVYRETPVPGGIVARIASSHIRVGTFQYFAAKNDVDSLRTLLDFAIARHFPFINKKDDYLDISNAKGNPNALAQRAVQFLHAVIEKQIDLVVAWMRVGFIHGVMNTDNTAISGETIDYGPCAMLNAYDQGKVYSSIDRNGRYAFGNQPHIIQWNMARLAETLMPLISDDEDTALSVINPIIQSMTTQFQQKYLPMLMSKLGWADQVDSQKTKAQGAAQNEMFNSSKSNTSKKTYADLINQLLTMMQENTLDHTYTYANLTASFTNESATKWCREHLKEWFESWQATFTNEVQKKHAQQLMQKVNPLVIPRNHHVEAILQACEISGNTKATEDFLLAMRSPYSETMATTKFQQFEAFESSRYQTFCGT